MKKFGRVCSAIACAVAAVGVASSHAGAVTINTSCAAFAVNAADGSKGNPIPGPPRAQALTLGDLGGGVTEIPAGISFTLVTDSSSAPMPTVAEGTAIGTVPIVEVKNIIADIEITGAASIGTVTMSGGNVINPTVTFVTPTRMRLTLPGSTTTSQFPVTGNAFFPPGSTLVTPSLSIPITAGAAGTTLSGSVVGLQIDSIVDASAVNIPLLPTRLECTPEANSLGSVPIVAPPEPGAPTAVNDTATTAKNTPTTIDVRRNDTPDATNAQLPIDPSSLKITSPPTKGTATVTADFQVLYTPNANAVGSDTFTYSLCSELPDDAPEGTEVPCDDALVTVTVTDPTATTTTAPPVTVAAPTTTAAKAAPAALPETGSAALPLSVAGLVLLVGGCFLVLRFRRSTGRSVG